MSTRKLLLLSCFLLFAFVSNAQSMGSMSNDWGWSWRDSAIVPAAGKEQFTRFVNNDYPYPPKPRNMWELGFGAGVAWLTGDVNGKPGFWRNSNITQSTGSYLFNKGWSYRYDHFWRT